MPTIQEATGQDLSAYQPAFKASPEASLPPTQGLEPTLNTMIRCPLPPIFQASTDSLRQFYNPVVPQTRFLSPVVNAIGGGTSTAAAAVIDTVTPTPPVVPSIPQTAQQIAITTPNLNANATFVGSVQMAKGFQLLNITTTSASRVRLYGTAAAQAADNYRGLDVPPPAGVVQNIICDVVLDTAPYTWTFQSRTGANGDSPQSTTIYVAITNTHATSEFITLTIGYVSLES